jgi:hypothetical protein
VSTATTPRASSGSLLDRVERTAWRVPLPTRRLFVTLAWVAALALAASGAAAGWVAARNARILDDAREQGLELATSVTEFRTRLASADARAAATLIAGGLEDPDARAAYDADLLAASNALTEAGLVATEADREEISALGAGLVDYASLVETSRANSRLGFPVGSAYLNQARNLANDELVPTAEALRREGEIRIAEAANDVGGPVGALAIVLLVGALVILAGCGLVIAGRTRRIAHPALVAACVAVVAALVVVFGAITSQARELRQAASGDIDAYVAANEIDSALSDLRVTEISAVAARGSGGPLYERFRVGDPDNPDVVGAEQLLTTITDAPGDGPSLQALRDRVQTYVEAVATVEETDLGGDNDAAAGIALAPDGSAGAYEAASTGPVVDEDGDGVPDPPLPGTTAGNVVIETDDLAERFDAAADADVHPLIPIALGGVAAVLAVGGTLARGRRYR